MLHEPRLREKRRCCTFFFIGWLFALSTFASAQLPASQHARPQAAKSQTPATTESLLDALGYADIPPAHLRGLNASVNFTSVHESTTGWATLFTPAIGYTFNNTFSVDASIPIYMYRLTNTLAKHPRPNAYLVPRRGEPGDIVFGLHALFIPSHFLYQTTAAITAPTGDEIYGLTTGRVTFDFNNHVERTFARYTPNLEFGVGDSTTLVNRILNKNYTSLGPLAHFQIGLSVDLLRRASFETDAYEQLPIGDQKIYRPARHGHGVVVTGYNTIEDNGFINSLNIPFDRHTTLSGYYSRSLRLRYDTAAIGITYVLRGTPPEQETSLDDLFR